METLQQQKNPQKASYGSRSSVSDAAIAYPSRTIVHAKLEMTEPGDHDEQEADAAANDIVSGGKIRRKISGNGGSSGISVSPQVESQIAQLQGGGHAMPTGLRNMMENGFGRDFSQVRLHTDSQAADMSSSISARAFTHGNDIYFNRGQFSPNTSEGQHLVAHELTHVAQGTGKVGRDTNIHLCENIQTILWKSFGEKMNISYNYFSTIILDIYHQDVIEKYHLLNIMLNSKRYAPNLIINIIEQMYNKGFLSKTTALYNPLNPLISNNEVFDNILSDLYKNEIYFTPEHVNSIIFTIYFEMDRFIREDRTENVNDFLARKLPLKDPSISTLAINLIVRHLVKPLNKLYEDINRKTLKRVPGIGGVAGSADFINSMERQGKRKIILETISNSHSGVFAPALGLYEMGKSEKFDIEKVHKAVELGKNIDNTIPAITGGYLVMNQTLSHNKLYTPNYNSGFNEILPPTPDTPVEDTFDKDDD